ncbi:hypothetical protein V7128_01130 [Neobacillus vireti]|uniref:hypothetical protein n=1 Tax=Neobacillus vireti TaxID=220686 RepID=UPI002FFD8377
MQLNFCVKNPAPFVNYKFINPIIIEQETVRLNNINFHIPTLIKEVKQLPKSKIKHYKKTIQTFLITASSFTMLPLKSMAASSVPVGTTNLPESATGMPPELLQLLIQILKISVGTAVLLSMILLVGAGVMRMFRKKKEATEWTTDIVKGLIQILIAVPIVFLIYFVVNLLFSNSGWFVSPF